VGKGWGERWIDNYTECTTGKTAEESDIGEGKTV